MLNPKMLTCSVLLCALSAVAQTKDPVGTPAAPGCGDPSAKFEVKTAKGQHAAKPDATNAILYFIEDDTDFGSFPRPTTRVGLDGEWAGATHGNSYLSLSVPPGVHHLCASWQTRVILYKDVQSAAAHFTAEAGGIYYFRVKNNFWREQGSVDISLLPLDSDEGQLMLSKFAYATSQPKK